MKKALSLILAMAMALSMMSAFAIDPVENVGFDIKSNVIYEKDFNTVEDNPFNGTDLDTALKMTNWDYVEVGENDNAIQVTYEIPTFEDVFNALPEVIEDDPSTSKDESLGRSQANYTEDQYNKEIRTSGYLAITGDKGSFAADTEAYVMDFDIYFPAVPDYGSSVNIWNGIKQNGVRSVQNFAMSYNDTYDEDGELVEAGDKFGFSVGGQFKEIEADTWYECTQVIDIKDRYTYFYVDGEYMGRHDIAAKGPVNAVGYMRAVYTPYGMDDGFMLDNIQLYEAKSEEAVEDKSNPYKYVSFGSEGLTFDGYTMNDSNQFVKSDSSLASIYGKNIGATIADSTWTIADDPEGGSNKVLAIDTALASGATYYNVSSSLHAPAEGTAVVYTIDFYLDSEVGGTDQKTLMMSKWLMKPDGDPAASSTGIWTYLYAVRSGNNVVIKQGNNGAGGFAGKNIATVSLDEWHTVTFVGTQAGDGYIYVDDELVSTDEINSGYYMAGIDYMRFSLNKAGGITYIDNYNIYEAKSVPVSLIATGYTAGASKIGDAIALTAESYIAGETAIIQMSTDGDNWTTFTGTAAVLTANTVYYRAKVGDYVSDAIILYGSSVSNGHPYNYIVKEGPILTFDDITIVEPTDSKAGYFTRDNVTVTGLNGGSIIAGEAGTKATISNSPAPAYAGDKAFVYSVNAEEENKKLAIFSQQSVFNATGTNNAIVLEFDRYVKSSDAGTEAKNNLQFIYSMFTINETRAADVVYMSRAANGTWTLTWNGATIHNATAFKEDQWNNIAYIIDHETNKGYVYINDGLVAEKEYAAAISIDYIRANGFGTVSFPLYMDNWHMYVAQKGEKAVESKKVWDVDFEGLTIANDKVVTDDGTPIQNSVNGQFTAKATLDLQTSSTDETPNGETATLSIEAVPGAYAAGHGDALKFAQTGGGYAKTPAMIIMYLGNGGNNFGSPDADGNTPADGDVYVTEFDFAFDSDDMDGAIEIGQFRGSAINGRYVTLAKNASNHFTFAGADYGIKIEGNKWYHVKVVADPATSVVRAYVDGVFAGQADHSATGLGLFESFRLFGGTNPSATDGVSGLWYDNFKAYVTAPFVAPIDSDVKLGTIAYANGAAIVDQMGDYDDLKVTATLTNNGVADGVIAVFALYDENDILKTLTVKPVAFGANEASRTVTGELGASDATDTVKVFLWDNLGGVAPKGEITATNASL